jgi:hypothetical protein
MALDCVAEYLLFRRRLLSLDHLQQLTYTHTHIQTTVLHSINSVIYNIKRCKTVFLVTIYVQCKVVHPYVHKKTPFAVFCTVDCIVCRLLFEYGYGYRYGDGFICFLSPLT